MACTKATFTFSQYCSDSSSSSRRRRRASAVSLFNGNSVMRLSSHRGALVMNNVLERSKSKDKRSSSNNIILVSEKLGEAGLKVLREWGDVECAYDLSPEELCSKISCCDALIVRSATKVTREVFQASKGRLKVVGRAGVGIDNVDLQAATEFGCIVVNAPTSNTVAAAELAIAHLAAMARNVARADASMKAAKWERNKYVGVSMVGKTVAIMGFGKVGYEVARRARAALGMNVVAHDPYASADRASAIGVHLASFDEAISNADFISLHMPLIPSTHKIFNHTSFAKMKRGVRIINVARGGVIDEDDLVRALDDGTVAEAALDVFTEEPPAKDSKLVQHEKVRVTPHLGGSTKEAQEGVGIEIAEAVMGALKGELSASAVNAPTVPTELVSELAPYFVLAEKLGRVAGQLVSESRDVKVVYRSAGSRKRPDHLDTRLLRSLIIKGLIEPTSNSVINLVNADFIAEEKGVRISEEIIGGVELIDSIQLQISNVISIEGKVKYGSPHLTRVGSFDVDVSLEGNLILYRQLDQPGMIGRVGNILGQHNVNVSFMSLGRTFRRKMAIVAIGVDEEPSNEALQQIGALPAIQDFVFLKL